MKIGAAMFFTDYSMSPAELALALEERGFDSDLGAGAFAYPAGPQDVASQRRRAAEAVLRRHGSLRDA